MFVYKRTTESFKRKLYSNYSKTTIHYKKPMRRQVVE